MRSRNGWLICGPCSAAARDEAAWSGEQFWSGKSGVEGRCRRTRAAPGAEVGRCLPAEAAHGAGVVEPPDAREMPSPSMSSGSARAVKRLFGHAFEQPQPDDRLPDTGARQRALERAEAGLGEG